MMWWYHCMKRRCNISSYVQSFYNPCWVDMDYIHITLTVFKGPHLNVTINTEKARIHYPTLLVQEMISSKISHPKNPDIISLRENHKLVMQHL
jgi:hypothetical protein